jgi:hypothetical protein
MEPGKWALEEALAAIEAKPAISFMQRRVRPPRPKLTWTLRRLFTKSELHQLRKSKS